MYRFVIIFFWSLIFVNGYSQLTDLFDQLDKDIKNEWYQIEHKEDVIDSLKTALSQNVSKGKGLDQYNLHKEIARQ